MYISLQRDKHGKHLSERKLHTVQATTARQLEGILVTANPGPEHLHLAISADAARKKQSLRATTPRNSNLHIRTVPCLAFLHLERLEGIRILMSMITMTIHRMLTQATIATQSVPCRLSSPSCPSYPGACNVMIGSRLKSCGTVAIFSLSLSFSFLSFLSCWAHSCQEGCQERGSQKISMSKSFTQIPSWHLLHLCLFCPDAGGDA